MHNNIDHFILTYQTIFKNCSVKFKLKTTTVEKVKYIDNWEIIIPLALPYICTCTYSNITYRTEKGAHMNT